VPPGIRLVFQVEGQSRLEGVVRMLEDFHRTNLLHKVRQFSILKKKGSRNELDLKMTVEALLVDGAQVRDALTPDSVAVQPQVLAQPGRRYGDLGGRNVFFGTAASLTENRVQVLRHVRLTTLFYNGRRWEAYLYDQGKGGDERMLTATTVTDFTVTDRYNVLVLAGTVVHLDGSQMIFRSDGKYYRMRCGDFLYPAVDHPLPPEEVQSLGRAAARP
jgi:hypothetical protein